MTHKILIKSFSFLMSDLTFFTVTLLFELFVCSFLYLEWYTLLCFMLKCVWWLCFLLSLYIMKTSIRNIIFKHLKELLQVKFYLKCLIQFYKSHYVWNLRPPMLVSHVEDLKGGINDFRFECEKDEGELDVWLYFFFTLCVFHFFYFVCLHV